MKCTLDGCRLLLNVGLGCECHAWGTCVSDGTVHIAWQLRALSAEWPAGQRDKVFTLMYSSNYLASSVGPVVAAVLFYFRGNNW